MQKYIDGESRIEDGQPEWCCEDGGVEFMESDPYFDNYRQDFEK
jgi:hypothetical protein